MAYTTVKTMGTEAAVSADWNTYIRDNLAAMVNWTSYTPSLKQGATTITCTVNYAKYQKFGTTCKVVGFLTATAAGTTGSAVTVSMPSGATSAYTTQQLPVGSGRLTLASVSYSVVSHVSAATNIAFYRTDTTLTNQFGADPSARIQSGDVVSFNFEYETT